MRVPVVLALAVSFASTALPAGPTDAEIREAYMGNVYARLPDRSIQSWVAIIDDATRTMTGVVHVEDRGVEMLWLERSETTTPAGYRIWNVVDVLVLPKGYRQAGLSVVNCERGEYFPALVALYETVANRRVVRRAWGLDSSLTRFAELETKEPVCRLPILDD